MGMAKVELFSCVLEDEDCNPWYHLVAYTWVISLNDKGKGVCL